MTKLTRLSLLACLSLACGEAIAASANAAWDAPGNANPVLPGYFADPDVLEYQGRYYMYATVEPWGGERLACWVSDDFREWEYHELNWPTKAECTTPKSGDSMVWAPGVAKGADGKFYLYVSVGSEIWMGVADAPLGPWRNALGDRPLIPFDYRPGYHMIDADVFMDSDSKTYLYWGSGWGWTNGKCFVVQLGEDMASFVGEPQDVTPDHYFEAPMMFREGDRYYLMYSDGVTIKDTYQIHYAVGDSPLGPFQEASNSPILVTDHERGIVSPGHHTVAQIDGDWYIIYHRNTVPYVEGQPDRRVCVDRFSLNSEGLIQLDGPTHRGPSRVSRPRDVEHLNTSLTIRASSSAGDLFAPEKALDDTYATLWRAASDDANPWLELDLGAPRTDFVSELRLEYPGNGYDFKVLASSDGKTWTEASHCDAATRVGSPYKTHLKQPTRYLKLEFAPTDPEQPIGVWEWDVR